MKRISLIFLCFGFLMIQGKSQDTEVTYQDTVVFKSITEVTDFIEEMFRVLPKSKLIGRTVATTTIVQDEENELIQYSFLNHSNLIIRKKNIFETKYSLKNVNKKTEDYITYTFGPDTFHYFIRFVNKQKSIIFSGDKGFEARENKLIKIFSMYANELINDSINQEYFQNYVKEKLGKNTYYHYCFCCHVLDMDRKMNQNGTVIVMQI